MNFEEPAAQAPADTLRAGVLARTGRPRIDALAAKENLPPAFDLVLAIRCLPRQRITVRPARHAAFGDLSCPRNILLDALRNVTRVVNVGLCPFPPVPPPPPPPEPPRGAAVVVAVQFTIPVSHPGLDVVGGV